jgi:hypothetical protein
MTDLPRAAWRKAIRSGDSSRAACRWPRTFRASRPPATPSDPPMAFTSCPRQRSPRSRLTSNPGATTYKPPSESTPSARPV